MARRPPRGTNPIIDEILRQGRGRPASQVAAALETGRVESNFTNPSGGDADSAGWRQERASLYPDPTNVRDSVRRFYQEAASLDHGQPSYELAADVQRPAAQYRGRYKGAHAEALALMHGGGAAPAAGTRTASTTITTPTQTPVDTFDQAGYDAAVRKQRLATFLSSQGLAKNNPLFQAGVLSTQPVDRTQFAGTATKYGSKTTTVPGSSGASSAIGGTSGSVAAAARAVQKQFGALNESAGSNRGKSLDKLEATDQMIGQPWCGIFAGAVLKQMGVSGVGSWIASVAAIEAHARQASGPFSGFSEGGRGARPGDLVIPAKGVHVAVVTGVDPDGTIHVIGGNNSNGTVGTATYKNVYGVAHVR